MQISSVKLADIWDQLEPLFQKNYAETGLGAPLDILKDFYLARDKAGSLHVAVAQDQSGVVGYSIFHLSKHPHYKNTLFATQDCFFVEKNRRGLTGVKLFNFVEQELLARGAQYIVRDSDLNADLTKMFTKAGYREIKKIFLKKL